VSRSGWLASGLLFSMVALFLWLGFWQLDRASQKEQAVIERHDRIDDGVLKLSGNEVDAELVRYRQVEINGEFLGDAQFFLDNRKYKQTAGYYVMVPLKLMGSERAVLVNRGWIAQGYDRTLLPQVEVPSGPQQLEGVVRVPSAQGFRLEEKADAPRRLYIDLEQIGESIGMKLLPFVIRQQSELNSGSGDGLVREWKVEQKDSEPAMHYGYALQWFAFALLLIGGWIGVVVKQRRESVVTSE